MRLLEFITYCQLKGFLRVHCEVEKPVHDTNAEKYFMLNIQGRAYSATIRYATIGDQAVTVRCRLFDYRTKLGVINPELKDIVKAFIPSM